MNRVSEGVGLGLVASVLCVAVTLAVLPNMAQSLMAAALRLLALG